jgi:hypothetical protein
MHQSLHGKENAPNKNDIKTCTRHSFRVSEDSQFLRSKQTNPVPTWFEKILPPWGRWHAPSGAHRWSCAAGSWIPQGFADLKDRTTQNNKTENFRWQVSW